MRPSAFGCRLGGPRDALMADRISALRGLARFYMDSGDYPAALKIGRQMLALAERQRAPELLAAAHAWLGFLSVSKTELLAARSHCEQALASMRDMRSSAGTIWDITLSPVITLTNLSSAIATLGFFDQAAVRIREAIAQAQGTPMEAFCQLNVAVQCAILHNWQLAREHSEAALMIEAENELSGLVGLTKATHGLAIAMLDHADRGIAEIREALSNQSSARLRAMGLRFLAEACLAARRAEDGLAALDGFASFLDRPSIVDALRGDLLLIQEPADEREAERLLRHAVEVAREQSARLYELRATNSLARLLKRQGKVDEARRVLSDIYGWFTEGFDTADLKDANALLDEVGS
jgi:tetratricopeptide (TPR) repeat protein